MRQHCKECKSEIKGLALYKTSYYTFCNKTCGQKFLLKDTSYYCSKCKGTYPASQFLLKDKSTYVYLSKVCFGCRSKGSKRLVIRFVDEKIASISHTGYDSFEIVDGILIISSKKDGQRYHYPMTNILVVDEVF